MYTLCIYMRGVCFKTVGACVPALHCAATRELLYQGATNLAMGFYFWGYPKKFSGITEVSRTYWDCENTEDFSKILAISQRYFHM